MIVHVGYSNKGRVRAWFEGRDRLNTLWTVGSVVGLPIVSGLVHGNPCGVSLVHGSGWLVLAGRGSLILLFWLWASAGFVCRDSLVGGKVAAFGFIAVVCGQPWICLVLIWLVHIYASLSVVMARLYPTLLFGICGDQYDVCIGRLTFKQVKVVYRNPCGYPLYMVAHGFLSSYIGSDSLVCSDEYAWF